MSYGVCMYICVCVCVCVCVCGVLNRGMLKMCSKSFRNFLALSRCVDFLQSQQNLTLLTTLSYNTMHTQVMPFCCSLLLVFPFCLRATKSTIKRSLPHYLYFWNDQLFARQSLISCIYEALKFSTLLYTRVQ